MSLPPRTPVRHRTKPGEPPRPTIGYVAPPESYSVALVRTDFNHSTEELEDIYSPTAPTPGRWVVVWWPGGRWTWEDVDNLEVVDPKKTEPPPD